MFTGLNSYLWNTGETTSAISINAEGIYSVNAIDENGCELNDEINIQSVIPIQVEIQTTMDSLIICKGSEFVFSVSQSFSNVVWNNISSGNVFSEISNNFGENTIYVEAIDENGCSSKDSIVLKVIDCGVSVNEDYLSNTMIFPNPTTGEFIVQHQSTAQEIKSIKIRDIQSRIIEERTTEYVGGVLNEKFKINGLSKGLYLVELYGLTGKSVRKIILE